MLAPTLRRTFTAVGLAIAAASASEATGQPATNPIPARQKADPAMAPPPRDAAEVKRIERLQSGLVQWKELTPSETHNPRFIVAGLQIPGHAEEVIKSLSNHDLDDVAVQDQLVKTLEGGHHYFDLDVREKLLDHKGISRRLLALDTDRKETTAVWDSVAGPLEKDVLRSPLSELVPAYRKMAAAAVGLGAKEAAAKLELVPGVFKGDIQLGRSADAVLAKHGGSYAVVSACASFSKTTTAEVVTKLLPHLTSADAATVASARRTLAKRLTPDLLSDKALEPHLVSMMKDERGTMLSLWFPRTLVSTKQFEEFSIRSLKNDPSFAEKFPESLLSKSSAVRAELIRQFELPENKAKLLGYTKKLSDFVKIPLIALEVPDVKQALRATCNKHLYEGNDEKLPKDLYLNVDRFAIAAPEILRLPRDRGYFRTNDHTAERCIAINPGAFANFLATEPAPTSGCILQYQRTVEATRLLGISGLDRFDNFREIIRQKYAFSSPEIQRKVRPLLPFDYFEGIETDTRPICIIFTADPQADDNGAFSYLNSSRENRDLVDRLTVFNRVIFIEVSDTPTIGRECEKLHLLHKVKADLMFLIGHGSQGTVSLSHFHYGPGKGELSADDKKTLAFIKLVLNDFAKVGVISCSTGASKEAFDSIHTALRLALENCYVIAPDADTPVPFMYLAPDGSFVRFQYVGANSVIYDPRTKAITIEPGLPKPVEKAPEKQPEPEVVPPEVLEQRRAEAEAERAAKIKEWQTTLALWTLGFFSAGVGATLVVQGTSRRFSRAWTAARNEPQEFGYEPKFYKVLPVRVAWKFLFMKKAS